MTFRIEVSSKKFDTRATIKKKKLDKLGFKNIKDLWITDVYTIDIAFSQNDITKIASSLTNPITQSYVLRREKEKISPKKEFAFAIEIGFLPGVTDNVAHTTREIIEDMLKMKFERDEDVYTSQITFIAGEVSEKEAREIASTMYNPLIQRVHIKSYEQFAKDGGMDVIVPKVTIVKKPEVIEVDLNVSDEELIKIGKSGVANPDGTRRGPLAMDLQFMKTIQKHFNKLGRNPTDIEIESISQTWSEHCKHTIFANPIDEVKEGLYKSYIKKATREIRQKRGKADICVSVFTDNSGAIAFDDEYLVTHKVETHNSPSALDPFGGAITGIVGVNRDTLGFGLGAKPIANFYGFCLANPEIDIPLFRDKDKTQKMLSSHRIMDGVIDGINAGGNQSGIPTPQGFIYFDESYRGKPLVFAGTVGLIPRKIKGKLSHIKKANPGDLIVVVGGRVGKDGIHGATFSSESLDSGSPAAAVQIGDPITQKKLSDALIKEARDQLLYTSITDNGAGGLSCSVSEMAKESGGCQVELDKVPLKYHGLDPWEIWISESQERMTLAVPPKNWGKFLSIMEKRGVEATVIGKFTNNGACIVNYDGKKIMNVDLDFLHDGLPQRPMVTKKALNDKKEQAIVMPKDQNATHLSMMKRLNIASFDFISKQYDHMVQASLVLGPLQGRGLVNGDASVIRPVLTSQKGVIMAQGMYPSYSEIDPYLMAASSIDTAIRNAVAAGANPDYLSLLDNFCWCSSNDPERLWQLKNAAKACYDLAVAYGTPYISGKDSMFNDFKGFDKNGNPVAISIQPTLLISAFGVVNDINKTVSIDAKNPGDLIYILGETFDELGGSEYIQMQNSFSHNLPKVDEVKNKKLYQIFYKAVQKDLITSSISIGRGGLSIALTKKLLAGKLGAEVSLNNLPGSINRDDFALYSESQGRLLVTVSLKNKGAFEKQMKGNVFKQIGHVTKNPVIKIKGLKNQEIINLDLAIAENSYREAFRGY